MTQRSRPSQPSPPRPAHAAARVIIGGAVFDARFRDDVAPLACARLRTLLPLTGELTHGRWSGEACWMPLANLDLRPSLDLGLDLRAGDEPLTDRPEPGDILLYPGGISEAEILVAYGPTRFASQGGGLAGWPVLSICDQLDRLADLGRDIWRNGSRSFEITALPGRSGPGATTQQEHGQ